MKFNLGMVVATKGLAHNVNEDSEFKKEIDNCLNRHCSCDWGDVSEEDAKLNNTALSIGEQILSAYETSKGRIWIVTEHDRSSTTVLFPSEY